MTFSLRASLAVVKPEMSDHVTGSPRTTTSFKIWVAAWWSMLAGREARTRAFFASHASSAFCGGSVLVEVEVVRLGLYGSVRFDGFCGLVGRGLVVVCDVDDSSFSSRC